MELRHLRYFIAVAEELNFSRAAQRLHVSQPPLSRQIRDLEAELNVTLFERTRQSVRLTSAGRITLHHARKLLRDTDLLRSEAQLAAGTEQEELHIGYAPRQRPICFHRFSVGSRNLPHKRASLFTT